MNITSWQENFYENIVEKCAACQALPGSALCPEHQKMIDDFNEEV